MAKRKQAADGQPQIKFDRHNFRTHNDDNKRMIHDSLAELGAGRSVVVDKENELIAGNGVYEQAQKLGMPVRIIETDGSELVVVKRTDLATDDMKRKKLAAADNAISDNVTWNVEEIRANLDETTIEELHIELPPIEASVNPDDFGEEFSLPNGGKSEFGVMTFTVTDAQREFINDCISLAINCEGMADIKDNKNENGAGLYLICKDWFSRFDSQEKPSEVIEQEYKELRLYLVDALAKSGKKSSDVDKLLGTSGMAGHYFGESQWMLPKREAYEKLKTIMPLDRDYTELKLKEMAYNRQARRNQLKNEIKQNYGTL